MKTTDRSNQKEVSNAASSLEKKNSASVAIFEDNRTETLAQRQLISKINNSPQVNQMKVYQAIMNNAPTRSRTETLQKYGSQEKTELPAKVNPDVKPQHAPGTSLSSPPEIPKIDKTKSNSVQQKSLPPRFLLPYHGIKQTPKPLLSVQRKTKPFNLENSKQVFKDPQAEGPAFQLKRFVNKASTQLFPVQMEKINGKEAKDLYWSNIEKIGLGEFKKISGKALAELYDGSWGLTENGRGVFTNMLKKRNSFLTTEQVKDICSAKGNELTSDHVKELVKGNDAIKGIPVETLIKHDELEKNIARLSTDQLEELSQENIDTLSEETIGKLDQEKFKAVSKEISKEKIKAIVEKYSTEQIEKDVSNLGKDKNSKKQELKKIHNELGSKINTLPEETFDEIKDSISAEQAIKVTDQNLLAKIPKSKIIGYHNNFFKNLMPKQVKILVANGQLDGVSAKKIKAMVENCFLEFDAKLVNKLEKNLLRSNIPNLEAKQIDEGVSKKIISFAPEGKKNDFSNLKDSALKKLFSFNIYSSLTDAHIAKIDTAKIDIEVPEGEKTPIEQIIETGKITALDDSAFLKFKAEHLQLIKTENFDKIKGESLSKLPMDLFKQLDSSLFKKFTSSQLKSLSANRFKAISANQFKKIRANILSGLTNDQGEVIKHAQFETLDTAKIGKIPSAVLAKVPDTVFATLNLDQLKGITIKQAKKTTAKQFKSLSFVQIAELTDAAYNIFKTKYIDKDTSSGGLKYKGKKTGKSGQGVQDLEKHHYDLSKVYDTRIEALIEITAFASKMNEKLSDSLLKVKAKYKSPNDDNKENTLSLIYQINARWTGYVVSVYDEGDTKKEKGKMTTGGNTSDKQYLTDYNSGTGRKTGHTRADEFSNQHHQALANHEPDTSSGENKKAIKTQIGLDHSDKAERYDAITKIAGEGARWKAVRNQAAKGTLSNLTKFFTRQGESDSNKMRFVYFMDLWKSWKLSFSKKYNIDNKVVADKLKNDQLEKNAGSNSTKKITEKGKNKSNLAKDKDFDLDNDKPYEDDF